ncbi:hypothetical protein RI129_002899 [Pyrocoelia pectoralis]|uniref:Integrase catalytic domain-containing protein n=1 Tax=Pyrocoelia pectoralis TaxID=417401 RepID=A0AAN7ZML3_9COLE
MPCRETLVKKYFMLGLQHNEILLFLKLIHGIKLSLRTLKRIVSKLNLHRRMNFSNIEDIVKFLEERINGSGQMHGYRWMHLKCIQHGFVVTQDIVRELLNILDPDGVALRKRKRLRRRRYHTKGPNALWHMDSYDKLKPFGICINGCIDGYSRHIVWLRAASTSSKPEVIAGYYVDSIKILGGVPETIRSDMGTENKSVEKLHVALLEILQPDLGKPAFLMQNMQYWMNLFETLKTAGLFSGSFLDKALIQFCFLEIIQNELDEIALEWNTHKIQKSRNARSPSGRPIIMYQMPELYNSKDYLIELPLNGLTDILEQECIRLNCACDQDVFDLCILFMTEHNYRVTDDPYDAIKLYINLRRNIYEVVDL